MPGKAAIRGRSEEAVLSSRFSVPSSHFLVLSCGLSVVGSGFSVGLGAHVSSIWRFVVGRRKGQEKV